MGNMDLYKKKYKEAMDRMELCVRSGLKISPEYIFPELAENKDERIRKALKQYFVNSFQNNGVAAICGVHVKDVLDWLEKQGEKKSITFNNGHLIDSALNDYCCKQYNALHKENGGVLSFARLQHLAMDIYGWCKEYLQGEQKPAWSEEDERLCQCLIEDQKETLDKVRNNKYGHSEIISDLKEMYHERIDWLKSLKQRIMKGE